MKLTWLSLSTLLILCLSCKESKNETSASLSKNGTVEIVSSEVGPKEIENLDVTEFYLDSKTEEIVKEWQAYQQLQDAVNNIKQADLNFFYDNDENIQDILKNLKENMPDSINSEATKARILALETKLYKLKSLSNLSTTTKAELLESIQGFLEAFSNVNFQMNAKVEADNIIINKPQ